MFKRRDLPPLFLLLVLICLIMVALSQILVVRQRNRFPISMRKQMLSIRGQSASKQTTEPHFMFGFSSESEKLLNEIYVSRISSLIRQTSSMSKRLAHNTQNFTVTTNKIHKKSSEVSSSSGSSSSNNNKNNNKDNKSDRLLNSGESQKSSQNFGSKSNKSTGRNSINKNTNNAGALSGLRTEMHTNTNISKTNRKVGEKNKNTNTQNNSNNNNNNNSNNNSSQSNNNNNNNNNNGNSSLTSRSDLDRIYDNMNGIKQRLMERPGNTTNGSSGVAQYCPEVPPDLQGKMLVNFNLTGEIKVNNIKLMNPALRSGGSWKPAHCISRHRVAIIIPYRDRHQHLLTLLYHLLPMLRRQQLDFRIFVVEQQGNETFNKGRIMNAAFKEALKLFTFHCCIFHDVDLIPEDDRNMYSCPEFPRHLSVAIDEMEYRLAYSILVGGVLNFKVEHFQMVNGYSNLYWGWGAEDDDMAYRILNKRLKIIRPPAGVARYKMVRHQKRKPASWAKRSKLLRTGRKRAKFDGLNNVKYKLIFSHEDALFTHFMVDIGPAPKMI